VVVLDYDGRIASINPAAARLLGREGPDLLGRSIGELDGPLALALAGLTAGGTSVVPAGGGRRVRCARGTFVDTGFPRTFYVLEELTEELRRAERAAYEKLIRVVSHEVNNTVGATGSLLDSCRRYARQVGEADRADFEGAIGVAIARGDQLNRFVRAFADVVRLPDPRRDPCEVGAILDDVARLLAPECGQRDIRWERRIEKPVVVPLDRAQMEQALLNVCRNAIEAVDRDGTVTVRLGRVDGRDTLAIEDTGPGIPDDARSHLFTPFFTTKPHGQGIGLTLVHEILTRHGLEHDLSGDPGGPTRFTIRFS
jgi:signal transduction histidine kinase